MHGLPDQPIQHMMPFRLYSYTPVNRGNQLAEVLRQIHFEDCIIPAPQKNIIREIERPSGMSSWYINELIQCWSYAVSVSFKYG